MATLLRCRPSTKCLVGRWRGINWLGIYGGFDDSRPLTNRDGPTWPNPSSGAADLIRRLSYPATVQDSLVIAGRKTEQKLD